MARGGACPVWGGRVSRELERDIAWWCETRHELVGTDAWRGYQTQMVGPTFMVNRASDTHPELVAALVESRRAA